ncbi:hypothetical protein NQ317_004481, partial [Molorchus minor]
MAIRCLKQLGATNVILRDFYVDDLVSGGESVEEVIKVCKEVDFILRSGCFVLRKWASNKSQVVETMAGSADPNVNIHFGEKEETKTLGLYWSSNQDFLIVSQIPTLTEPNQWRHIRLEDNPVNIVSRGLNPKDLLDCKLWWNGPSFLYNDESLWPDPIFLKVNDVPELRKTQMSFQINVAVPIVDFARFSNLSRLQ